MLRRTPLRRGKPLGRSMSLRRGPMRRSKRRSSYARRERDLPFMEFVRSLRCLLWWRGDCAGPVEADHAGERAKGRKAPDNTCIPLCSLGHHRQRTDYHGYFWGWTGVQMRAWCDEQIAATQALWAAREGSAV